MPKGTLGVWNKVKAAWHIFQADVWTTEEVFLFYSPPSIWFTKYFFQNGHTVESTPPWVTVLSALSLLYSFLRCWCFYRCGRMILCTRDTRKQLSQCSRPGFIISYVLLSNYWWGSRYESRKTNTVYHWQHLCDDTVCENKFRKQETSDEYNLSGETEQNILYWLSH